MISDFLNMKFYEELSELNSDTDLESIVEAADENAFSIDSVSSPEELMGWMDKNITYELANDDYGAENDPLTKTAKEVLETGTGHCAEQSYLEKEVLDDLGYETFLVMVKENSSKKDYGADGSAHVFLVYKEGKNYCWFEHSMQHAKGIHKYTSLDALLQDVANQWWRYDKNSDILEVRMMDKAITGVDNWGLAKECYKLPVKYTFDISNNIMESDIPLEEDFTQANSIEAMDKAIQEHFGQDKPGDGCVFIAPNGKFLNIYPELDDHESLAYWLQEQGFEEEEVTEEAEWFVEAFSYVRCRNSLSQCFIELPIKTITKYQLYSLEEWLETKVNTPTLDIEAPNGEWKNYDLDEYFPEDIIRLIKRCYASGRLYESQTQIDYLPVSDVELFKEYADDILDGYGNMSDTDIKSSIKEIHFEGKLAGYIGFSEYEEDGHKCLGIGNFMIIERGKGLGSAVIQNIVEMYKNQYDLIYCFVDAKNDGAIRLYKKLGKVYDEDDPNDNGEYYVTFWDNGNWKLDEQLKAIKYKYQEQKSRSKMSTLEAVLRNKYREEQEDLAEPVEEAYIEETYSDEELDDMVGKVYNIQKIDDIYRRKKYGEERLFAHTVCVNCGRDKRVFLSNLVNDPEKYGSCICSDTNIEAKIDNIEQLYDGSKKLSSNTSGYTGVSFVKTYKGEPYNKWRAYIEIDGVRTYLGDFDSKAKAVKARKTAGEKGIKWYKDNKNKLMRDVRKKTKKYKNSKYRETSKKTSVLKKAKK